MRTKKRFAFIQTMFSRFDRVQVLYETLEYIIILFKKESLQVPKCGLTKAYYYMD